MDGNDYNTYEVNNLFGFSLILLLLLPVILPFLLLNLIVGDPRDEW